MIILQQLDGLSDFKLEKQCIDLIFSEDFLVSLGISDSTIGIHSGKNIDNCKEKEIWRQLQNQLDYLDLKIKIEIIRNAISIQLDLGHAKVNKPRENKAKQKKNRLNKVKKSLSPTLDINFVE